MRSLKRRSFWLAAGGGLVVVLGFTAFGGETAEMPDEIVTARPREGVVVTDLPTDSPLAASVARTLPPGSDIASVVERVDATRDRGVDAIKFSTVDDRTGYEVTIYRNFATEELAGLPVSDSEAGRVWVSATDQDLTSIYHLSGAGVGLRVANLSPEAPAKVEDLTSIAIALASDPLVVEEAMK